MTDHTEMQIPDDVMEAARIVAASVWNDAGIEIKEEHLFGSMDNTTGVRVAARAILVERERCARIAEAAMYGSTASHRIKGGKT